jgi:hypothetical protein
MPSSVNELLAVTGLRLAGSVPWRVAPKLNAPGVYLVSIDADVSRSTGLGVPAPIDPRAIEALLAARPELRLHGERPSRDVLAMQIARFWLPDEPVLYIGLASKSVAKRVGQYYATLLGARAPHAGGWFLKTLSCLPDLRVHYAASENPNKAEDLLIKTFVRRVNSKTRHALADPERPFPFANLEWPRGIRKKHGITGARAPADHFAAFRKNQICAWPPV